MINLEYFASPRWRIAFDESVELDPARANRHEYAQIPGRYGHVYPFSDTHLAAYTASPSVGRRLESIPGVRVHQRGDKELTIVFVPELMRVVCDLLQCKRRRQLSLDQRSRLVAAGAASRFPARGSEREIDPRTHD